MLSGTCSANSLCSPKDNNARILSAPSPNAIDPQWSGGSSFVGTGWSFYVNETVKSPTGLFAKGNLHGSRGGIAQNDVYVLLSEWDCAESGEEVTEGIERVDADPADESTSAPVASTPEMTGPLADLTGVWAHSSADCKLANGGALDKMTRFESKQYQVVGICGNNFEYLQRAFSCETSDVKKVGDVLDVETSCRLKDYDPEKKRIHVQVRSADAVRFLDSDFEISGDYVRCSRSYRCNQN